MPQDKRINLLPKDKFESSTLGRFLKWSTSTGRAIVVLTEFVVICAFLSRFYFDTRLANLFDEINQKKAIVASAAAFEEDFRRTQEKIQVIKVLLTQESKPSVLISEISQLLPLDVSLTALNLEEKDITLSGYTFTENGLRLFWISLNQYPELEEVTLTNISSRKEGMPGLDFVIKATIKAKKTVGETKK
ncbi:MAG TPA: PilN domain-containing protein [Patescibacteria group bacterium]|nr:PilN domain-containing protein [Patescibacteria group bacterium]